MTSDPFEYDPHPEPMSAFALALVFTGLGPLIGTPILLVLVALAEGHARAVLLDTGSIGFAVVIYGYVFGTLPALITGGIVAQALIRRGANRVTLPFAAAVGAFATLVALEHIHLVTRAGGDGLIASVEPEICLAFLATGALTSLVISLTIGRWLAPTVPLARDLTP